MSATPDMFETALQAWRAGISVLPPREDGSKQPIGDSWTRFQHERASERQVREWYADGRTGLGFVCGPVSDDLELLDFDDVKVFEEFRKRVGEAGLGELLSRVEAGYSESTPGGMHLCYRCSGARTQKLAVMPDGSTVVETKGSGGFAIVAPSYGGVHPTGRPYHVLQGGPETIVRITPQEREELHRIARTLDQRKPRGQSKGGRPKSGPAEGNRPGDCFNARATWAEVLDPAEWVHVLDREGTGYWRRPGKTTGISATTNYGGTDRFYCFSTSTPFEVDRFYDKFAVYAALYHQWNFAAAARELALKGYRARPLEPEDFFYGRSLQVETLGRVIKDEGHVEIGIDGRLYHYEQGVYRDDGETFAKVQVRELLAYRFKSYQVGQALAWLRAHYPKVGDQQPEIYLNVANGLLDWRSATLEEHDPKLISTVQLPVRWNPEAHCPGVNRFLQEVLPEDAIDFVLEVIGYALYSRNPLRVAVLLLGPGANGKSVLLRVIVALLGERNVSTAPLQAFAENRFVAAELFGKLANICGDLDVRAIRQTDIFKAWTGGDPIQAERKYGHPFSFTATALPIFSANEAPLSSDQTEAWFDRWLVVPMEKRIPEDQRDPHLARKLTKKPELEGLLVQAVEGLGRLMKRGRFDLPDSVRKAGEGYRERLDTVSAFVTECCQFDPNLWTARPELYASYRDWAKVGGHFPLPRVAFNDHLRRGFAGRIEERPRRGVRGWAGIGLRGDSHG